MAGRFEGKVREMKKIRGTLKAVIGNSQAGIESIQVIL